MVLELVFVGLILIWVARYGLGPVMQAIENFKNNGGGFGSPPNHPIPGNDNVITLRRRRIIPKDG